MGTFESAALVHTKVSWPGELFLSLFSSRFPHPPLPNRSPSACLLRQNNFFRFESASSVLSRQIDKAMSTRSSAHPSLPAPVLQSGATSIQSKSRVLAGVQDAYWSDDEAVRGCSSWVVDDPLNVIPLIFLLPRPIDTRKTKSARFVSRRWISLT